MVPGFRPVAEDLLAHTSRIDVFGLAGDGAAVLALIGDEGDDLLLVARALAQRAWLAPRLSDWHKLAPSLGLRSDAPVRAIVLCPRFSSEARDAAGAVSDGVQLVLWRALRNGHAADLFLEPLEREAATGEPASAPPQAPVAFRTGLSESDLGLSAAERAEFD